MNATEKADRFTELYELGCIVCLLFYQTYSPPTIHHLQGIKYRGMGKKASDEHTIGLCPCHHQYGSRKHPSVHAYPQAFKMDYGTEEDLLHATEALLEARRQGKKAIE